MAGRPTVPVAEPGASERTTDGSASRYRAALCSVARRAHVRLVGESRIFPKRRLLWLSVTQVRSGLNFLEKGRLQIRPLGGAMATQKLTTDIINAAIEGFEVQKQRIDAQIAELRQMLNGSAADVQPAASTKKKRRMSAAGRKAIAEAQRRRWAATKGEKATVASTVSKPKRKLSKAGRAAIVAALKKRWAEKKAAASKA
jgi:hypothetical protein